MGNDSTILSDYAKRAHGATRLSAEKERELVLASQNGNVEAKKQIIDSNIYLVLLIVRRYRLEGEIVADMLQEGHIGLLDAIERFESKRKVRFSTYAGWWIRKAVQEYLENVHPHIRLPRNMQHTIRRIQHVYFNLYQQLGRAPSVVEVSQYIGMSVEKINQIGVHDNTKATATDFDIKKTTLGPLSVADGGIGDANIIDNISDKRGEEPVEQMFRHELSESLEQALSDESLEYALSDLEREVLRLRYHPFKRYSLRAIGEKTDCSAHEARRHLERALQKVKRYTRDFYTP